MAKKSRKMQATQAYSLLYYESKLKGVVAERWSAHKVPDGDKKAVKPPLWFCNKITKELFEIETDAVKEEVERYREDGFAEDDIEASDEEIDEEESKRRAKAKRYQW
jgi:hypothetical protein